MREISRRSRNWNDQQIVERSASFNNGSHGRLLRLVERSCLEIFHDSFTISIFRTNRKYFYYSMDPIS